MWLILSEKLFWHDSRLCPKPGRFLEGWLILEVLYDVVLYSAVYRAAVESPAHMHSSGKSIANACIPVMVLYSLSLSLSEFKALNQSKHHNVMSLWQSQHDLCYDNVIPSMHSNIYNIIQGEALRDPSSGLPSASRPWRARLDVRFHLMVVLMSQKDIRHRYTSTSRLRCPSMPVITA